MFSSEPELRKRLASRVQVWPCSLWAHEWAQQFTEAEAGCGELLTLTHPDVIEAAHQAILKAGADALVTNTFGATAIVMRDYGAVDKVTVVNRESARLADVVCRREVQLGKERCLIVGSIGPTRELLSVKPQTYESRRDEFISSYLAQAEALFEGGIRTFHLERCQDVRTAHTALLALAHLENQVQHPLARVVSAAVENEGLMLLGDTVKSFWSQVRPFGPDAFGVAGRLPGVELALSSLKDVVDIPIIATIDAFAMATPEGSIQSPESLSLAMENLVSRFNIRIAGIGVEARPDFIRALVDVLEIQADVNE